MYNVNQQQGLHQLFLTVSWELRPKCNPPDGVFVSLSFRKQRTRGGLGPWRVPCQFKKPFNGLRLRQGNCLEERKSPDLPEEGSLIQATQASQWFFKQNKKKKTELVSKPGVEWDQLKLASFPSQKRVAEELVVKSCDLLHSWRKASEDTSFKGMRGLKQKCTHLAQFWNCLYFMSQLSNLRGMPNSVSKGFDTSMKTGS